MVNLVLDPLLIFTFNLNVAGAAMATAIAQWAGAFAYAIKMYRRRKEFGMNEFDIMPTVNGVKVGSSQHAQGGNICSGWKELLLLLVYDECNAPVDVLILVLSVYVLLSGVPQCRVGHVIPFLL